MRPLTPSDREALDSRWAKLVTAAQQADYGDAWWNKRNDELNDLAQRSGWNEFRTAQKKADDPELRDAGAHWSHFKDEVLRHSAFIQAAAARRQLLAVDDDPTGLLYSRDDDEPVRPVPPGVDGLSITGRPKRRPSPNAPAGSAFDTVERRTPGQGRPGSQTAGAGTPTPASATPRAGAR